MTLPNFLIVGVQKAGTTSLVSSLGAHPGIFFPVQKEPEHFFLHGNSGEQIRCDRTTFLQDFAFATRQAYEGLFDEAGPAAAIGEASTAYFASERACEKIKAEIPHCRIIISLRDPVARAYSAFNWSRKVGWEPLETFGEALAVEDRRMNEGYWWSYGYARNGMYADHVAMWRGNFAHVKCILFEDYLQDPDGVLNGICSFLGVEPAPSLDTGEGRNVSGTDATMVAARLRRLLMVERHRQPKWLRGIRKVVPQSSLTRLKETMLNRLDRSVIKPKPLDPEIEARLREFFSDDIARLERDLGRDLSHWRHPVHALEKTGTA